MMPSKVGIISYGDSLPAFQSFKQEFGLDIEQRSYAHNEEARDLVAENHANELAILRADATRERQRADALASEIAGAQSLGVICRRRRHECASDAIGESGAGQRGDLHMAVCRQERTIDCVRPDGARGVEQGGGGHR